MRFYEYEAKSLLKKQLIGVPVQRLVRTVEEAASNILKLKIKGKTPVSIMVEPKCVVQQEYYLGVTYDAAAKLPIVIFSDLGV